VSLVPAIGDRPMTDPTKFQFTNASVPKAYDEFFVPRLFEPWAKLLLDEVNLRLGEVVLDVATGPGTVARLAAVRLGSRGRIVATDIAPLMLEIARAKPVLADAAPIEYLESPAAPLAASSGAFDAVLCQQGLQFFPDRHRALREMRRVLKPNGRAAIAVWAELEHNQIFAAFHAALSGVAPPELASLITAPFSWPSGAQLKDAAQEAGFRDVRLLTPTLPMVLEGGVEQAVRSFSATPVSPGVAALPQNVQQDFYARVRHEMIPLVRDGKVVGEMTSNIIIAGC
jgi:ubiquinone/menaquinone biosynthesis C-methylase UbiE